MHFGERAWGMNKKWNRICQNIPVSLPDSMFWRVLCNGAANRNNQCFPPRGQAQEKTNRRASAWRATWPILPRSPPRGPSHTSVLLSAAPWQWSRLDLLGTSARASQTKGGCNQLHKCLTVTLFRTDNLGPLLFWVATLFKNKSL